MAERKHIQKERCREEKDSKRAQKKSLSLQVEGGAIGAKAVQTIRENGASCHKGFDSKAMFTLSV